MVPAASDVGTPARDRRKFARQPAAWLMLARCVNAGEHDHFFSGRLPEDAGRAQAGAAEPGYGSEKGNRADLTWEKSALEVGGSTRFC